MSVVYRLVHASPERVFEVLADGWNYGSWVVGASRIRAVSPPWPQPGGCLHHSFGLWPVVINDTTKSAEWQPPTRAVIEPDAGPLGTGRVCFDLQSRADGCVIRMTEDATSLPGLLVPKPIRDAVGRIRNRETLRRLAFIAEQRESGG